MNHIITSIVLSLLFLGCADKNAFSRFEMKKEQELGAVNLQNSEIKTKDGEIKGIVSIVYLNNVYPTKYKDYEYFYVYLYLNDKQNLQNINFLMKLNDKTPLSLKKLSSSNEFSNLTSTYNKWTNYYLAKFKQEKESKIKFTIEAEKFKSATMVYDKDEE